MTVIKVAFWAVAVLRMAAQVKWFLRKKNAKKVAVSGKKGSSPDSNGSRDAHVLTTPVALNLAKRGYNKLTAI